MNNINPRLDHNNHALPACLPFLPMQYVVHPVVVRRRRRISPTPPPLEREEGLIRLLRQGRGKFCSVNFLLCVNDYT